MKVLFMSHYADGNSGWSNTAKDYIEAMDVAGIDIVPVAIKLNDAKPAVSPRIEELEKKSIKNCDVCIQYVLPHHLEYNGGFKKNVAMCVYEMFGHVSNWTTKINMMDELWTASNFSRECFLSAGVTIPIKVVPYAFNMKKYDKNYGRMEHETIDGNILFYTIADLNLRKNIAAFIRAFHIAFSYNMPVKLLIKTSKYGMSGEECAKIVQDECEKIKKSLKLYRRSEDYIPELIISEEISEDELMQIHSSCDVFVCTSHGEAWCVPLFEAVAMGNLTIGPRDMFDYPINYEVDGNVSPVKGMNDTFFEVGRGVEAWFDIDEGELKHAMIKAYNKAIDRKKVKINLSKFSYENVGNLIKEMLNA